MEVSQAFNFQQSAQTTYSRSASKAGSNYLGEIPAAEASTRTFPTQDILDLSNTIEITKKDDPEATDKIKALAQSLNDKKKDIDTRIQDALDKVGYSAGVNDNIKVEVDSGGKIVVSGVKDRTVAKQIEQELNKDKDLGKDIKNFRLERGTFSSELKKATGQSLEDLQRRKKSLDDPKELSMALMAANSLENQDAGFTAEDLREYTDISMLAEDDELMGLVRSFTESGDVDYATNKPGLADPLGTIERTGRSIMSNIAYNFKEYNKAIRMMWKDDEEEIQKRLLHIEDFQMRVGPNGEIAVEGKFAKEPESNQDAIEIIERELENAYMGDEFSATDSPLKTAMDRFMELHEDNFGDTDEFQHQLGFDIKNNGRSIEAYAYSPEAEAASTAEISASTTKYLEASGISKEKAQQLEFEVDDEGKIALATPVADEALAEQVEELLGELNSGLAKASGKEGASSGESDGSAVSNAVNEIAPHLKHVLSHRPGGGELSVARPDEDGKEDNAKIEEKKELFDKNLMIQKGTWPGTRSYSKPGIVRALERMA